MTYRRHISIISGLLVLLTVSMTTQAHTQRRQPGYWYIGLNTGASFIHNQTRDRFTGETNNELIFREDHSQRGFNGGAFVGWNFLCCDPYTLAVELSGDLYSNRGHYTIDLLSPSNGGVTSHFDVNYNMDYAVHLTLRPGYMINQSTLLYFQIGGAYAEFETEINNKLGANIGSGDPQQVKDCDWIWGFTLGAGLKKQLSCHLSVFAAYEYTYYGRECLSKITHTMNISNIAVAIDDREAKLDSNTFKVGIIFSF